MKPSRLIIIVVAIALAALVGYFSSSAPVAPPAAQNPRAPVEVNAALPSLPPAEAKGEELAQYAEVIRNRAEEAESVDIGGCAPSPRVLLVREGFNFTIKNSDTEPHTISVNKDHGYTIAAGVPKVVPADFGTGQGTYAYTCDNSVVAVGMFLVMPAE